MPPRKTYKKKTYKKKVYKKKLAYKKKNVSGRTTIKKFLMSNTLFVKLKA